MHKQVVVFSAGDRPLRDRSPYKALVNRQIRAELPHSQRVVLPSALIHRLLSDSDVNRIRKVMGHRLTLARTGFPRSGSASLAFAQVLGGPHMARVRPPNTVPWQLVTATGRDASSRRPVSSPKRCPLAILDRLPVRCIGLRNCKALTSRRRVPPPLWHRTEDVRDYHVGERSGTGTRRVIPLA
jgi:hypothetical protein